MTLDTWSGRTYIFPLTDSGLPWHAAARDSLLGPRRRERSYSPGVTTAQLEELVTEERETQRHGLGRGGPTPTQAEREGEVGFKHPSLYHCSLLSDFNFFWARAALFILNIMIGVV